MSKSNGTLYREQLLFPIEAAAAKPHFPRVAPHLEGICEALKPLVRWAVWRSDESGRAIPLDPATGKIGDPVQPDFGTSFEAAAAVYNGGKHSGLGFVLREEDPFVVIALEDAVAENGILTSEAAMRVDRLRSYTEISPSGGGVTIVVRASLPPGGRRRESLEMLESARFVAMTGQRWPGSAPEIAERQREVEALHANAFPHCPPPRRVCRDAVPPPESDDDLLALAFRASNGSRIRSLFRGDAEALFVGGSDRAAADLAFCSHLGFYTGDDPARLDRLFRRSGLYRSRWDDCRYSDGRTYGQATIAKALDGCLVFYAHTPEASPAAVPFTHQTATTPASQSPDREERHLAVAQGRAQGLALRDQVLTGSEAAAILKVSVRLLRKTVKPWRRFGSSPAGDRWLLSDLIG